MPVSQFTKDAWLNTLRNTPASAHASIQVALFKAGGEVSGGSYARATVATNNTTAFTAPANGSGTRRQITNADAITFPTPTADWSTSGDPITQVRIYAANGTDLLHTADESATGAAISKVVQSGDSVSIPAGELVVFIEDAA